MHTRIEELRLQDIQVRIRTTLCSISLNSYSTKLRESGARDNAKICTNLRFHL